MPIRSSAAVLVVIAAASAGWSVPVAAQSVPDLGIDWGRATDGASMALRGAPVDLSVTSSARTRDDLWLHPVPRGFDTTDHRVHGDLGWRAAGAVFGAHFDWRDLAPRAELGLDSREGTAVGASVRREWGDGGLALAWDAYGRGYAQAQNLWFADDRERWALSADQVLPVGRLTLGLEEQDLRESQPNAVESRRHWLAWRPPTPEAVAFRAELERVQRRPAGTRPPFERQSESRLRLVLERHSERLRIGLNTEYFDQRTDAGTDTSLRAALGRITAEIATPGPDVRTWLHASHFDAAYGIDAVVQGGLSMVATSLDEVLRVELGMNLARRDLARTVTPLHESGLRGRLRWAPPRMLEIGPFEGREQTLELAADLRHRDLAGGGEASDPVVTMRWTVR